MFNKFPKRSGIYRVQDNIERLQLRLQFRHINSLLKLPKFDLSRNAATDWTQQRPSPNNNNADDGDDDEVHTVTIGWQEKILSTGEMELYREASNCRTDAHRRYHEWLQAGGGAHVGHDLPAPTTVENSSSGSRTRSKKRCRNRNRNRHAEEPIESETPKQQPQLIFTYVHEDEHTPVGAEPAGAGWRTQEVGGGRARGRRHLPSPSAVMFIYASLQTDVLLVALRWHAADRLLHIYPDFSGLRDQPYFVEVDADYRHLYAYGLENVSPARPGPDPARQVAAAAADFLQLPGALPTHWRTEAQLADEFAMPPKRCRRVVLLLEIREARDFEYDRLHVRYRVRLPAEALLEEGQREGSTHTSSASGRRPQHFGHVCQLTLLLEEDFAQPLLPLPVCHVFFEVISVDGWQRERVEGFAHCAFPLQPPDTVRDACTADSSTVDSSETRHLRCLRPVESFFDSINRYFIGGRQRFDVERFFVPTVERKEDRGRRTEDRLRKEARKNGRERKSQNSEERGTENSEDGKNDEENDDESASESPSSDAEEEPEVDAAAAARGLHSRHGCRMQRTGVLTVAWQRVTQRNCELLEPCVNRGSGMTLDDIMLAYREARRRLEAVVLK